MSSTEFPETEAEIEPTSPESLKRRIDAGDRVTLLDTRAQSDFEEWHITDDTVTTINVPYFEFLDGIDDELVADIPADEPVVVTCAKGNPASSSLACSQTRGTTPPTSPTGCAGGPGCTTTPTSNCRPARWSVSTAVRRPAVWPI